MNEAYHFLNNLKKLYGVSWDLEVLKMKLYILKDMIKW